MFTKTKNYLHNFHWQSLKDPRYAVQLVFLILVLLMTWSGVKSIQTNYNLQKQIATLAQQNQVEKLENSNAQLQNEYYNTNQYLELSARQDFGLGVSGETELLVSPTVAAAHFIPVSIPSTETTAATSQSAWYSRNFQAWLNFLLHRPTSS